MFIKSVATGLSLMVVLGVGAATAASPHAVPSLCADPALVAAIDIRESGLINDNRLPGSGLAMQALPVLAGIHITDHRIRVVGGQPAAEPHVAICRVTMHLRAETPDGVKQAEQVLVYRITKSANSYAVAFCPNE